MGKSRLRPILVVLIAALLVAVAILVLRDDEGSVSLSPGQPEIVSVDQLTEFAADADTPVYWLGARENANYELTETAAGRVYVRYLSPDAEAGDKRANFITVATYPEEGGIKALREAASNREGARLGRTDDGAVLLVDPSSPDNAHIAYPGTDLQVEVYSPVPGQALRFASRGEVEPIE